MSAGAAGAPIRPRRARWPWVLLIIVIVLGALAVTAELLARSILPGVVRGIVIERLELPGDQQLEVDAAGVLLPQLIAGRLDELHLISDEVTFEGITGAVEVTALGVSLRGEDLRSAHGTVRLDEREFTALLADTDLPVDEITIAEGDITASGAVPVLGLQLPVSLTVTPAAQEGDLMLTPASISIAGATLDAEQVRQRLGGVGATITEPQRICIADRLPAGLTLTALRTEGSTAVAEIDVAGSIVTDERMQQPGTCD